MGSGVATTPTIARCLVPRRADPCTACRAGGRFATTRRLTSGMIGRMEREWVAEESALVAAPVDRVYAAVADLRRMGRWSPECFAVWVRGGAVQVDTRFTGFNRHGWGVWFTNCEVTLAEPGQAF